MDLHAGADPQSRRLGIALVLHAAAELYGELRDALGHFPLQHFWGPLANIKSTAWIVDSAVHLARRERPNFFYIYLPHLDYAAQKHGPDSAEAAARRSPIWTACSAG